MNEENFFFFFLALDKSSGLSKISFNWFIGLSQVRCSDFPYWVLLMMLHNCSVLLNVYGNGGSNCVGVYFGVCRWYVILSAK